MVNMEKEKLAGESTRENHYKLVTDEYFKLFEAFKASGFTEEQAFELTKAYCTSDSMARMLENYKFYTRSPKSGAISEYMNKRKGDLKNEAASSSL